jgi:hypothetical protein
VTSELSVRDIGEGKSEFANRVRSYATDEFLTFLAQQGIPFKQFSAQREPASIAHDQGETPLFAASMERAALRKWPLASSDRKGKPSRPNLSLWEQSKSHQESGIRSCRNLRRTGPVA